ncbi:MAG: sucrase ferredoxin [Cyanobacteria bacterium J06639_1]
MTSDISSIRECRYCSEYSQASGEAPIGTAGELDHWVAIALPQPINRQLWADRPALAPLKQLPRAIALRLGLRLRIVAIASEGNTYDPERVQVLHYARPKGAFASFQRSEYCLPEHHVVSLIRHALARPQGQSLLQQYRRDDTDGIRDLFVCTHTRHDLACGRYGTPLFRLLDREYGSSGHLRVWQCSHFGGHRFAPTVMDFPAGHCWGHLNSERIDDVLEILLERRGDWRNLQPYYRGWVGTHKFGQLLERELWARKGWDWLSYERSFSVAKPELSGWRSLLWQALRIVPGQRSVKVRHALAMQAPRAEIRAEFTTADGTAESCRASVEMSGQVVTMSRSDTDERTTVPQYRVRLASDISSQE